jgi:hypothetical protein
VADLIHVLSDEYRVDDLTCRLGIFDAEFHLFKRRAHPPRPFPEEPTVRSPQLPGRPAGP